MSALKILQNAVQAKIDYWDAMSALEAALGYQDGDVPDAVDNLLFETVENLATGPGPGEAELADLLKEIEALELLEE